MAETPSTGGLGHRLVWLSAYPYQGKAADRDVMEAVLDLACGTCAAIARDALTKGR